MGFLASAAPGNCRGPVVWAGGDGGAEVEVGLGGAGVVTGGGGAVVSGGLGGGRDVTGGLGGGLWEVMKVELG